MAGGFCPASGGCGPNGGLYPPPKCALGLPLQYPSGSETSIFKIVPTCAKPILQNS